MGLSPSSLGKEDEVEMAAWEVMGKDLILELEVVREKTAAVVIGGDGGNGGQGGRGGIGATGGDGGNGGNSIGGPSIPESSNSSNPGKPRKKKQRVFWPKLRQRVLPPAIRRQPTTTTSTVKPQRVPLWRFPAIPEPSQTPNQGLASLPLSDFTY